MLRAAVLLNLVALAGCATETVTRWGLDPSHVEPVTTTPCASSPALAVLRVRGVRELEDGYYGVAPGGDEPGGLAFVRLADLAAPPPSPRAHTVALSHARLTEPPRVLRNGEPAAGPWVAFEREGGEGLWRDGVVRTGGKHRVRLFVPDGDGARWIEAGAARLTGRPQPWYRRGATFVLVPPALLLDCAVYGLVIGAGLAGPAA